jgi:hypothetical protein
VIFGTRSKHITKGKLIKLGFCYDFPPKSPRLNNYETTLITREGLEKLKAELDKLWRVERPDTKFKLQECLEIVSDFLI